MHKLIKTKLLFLIAIACLLQLAPPERASAQSRLIHYWHFNNLTYNDTLGSTGCTYPILTPNRIRPVAADYSILDTSKAKILYTTKPGVSAAWPQAATYTVCFTFLDTASGTVPTDTANARMGAAPGRYLRVRNPSDSMQLLFYIPTTSYQNITLSYGCQSSSTNSGMTYQVFDYSLDSGATWNKTGLSKLQDSAWASAFHRTSVSILDPLANNNPKLVFRVTFVGHNAGNSGNNRFDNVTVEGDTVVPTKLIHYWNFNNDTLMSQLNPNFYPLAADYSDLDTSKAKILFGTIPGTSATNPTYFDYVSSVATDYDTVNLRQGATGRIAVRMRNPNDSTELRIYMPTTNFKNIKVMWGAQSSSVASGDSIEVYDYSIDSGVTWAPVWRISGLSEVKDSAWLVYKPVTVYITDPAAFNNPKLVFRIRLRGHNTGSSGNNRFDNFTVEGDTIMSANPQINTTAAAYGPFCSTISNALTVNFNTVGAVTGTFSVQATNPDGTFPVDFVSNIIGSGTTSPITATIPAGWPAGQVYRVRVISTYPYVYGSDNGNNIVLSAALPAITGTAVVCQNSATTLSNTATGGSWVSTNTAVATVGSTTGIVTGLANGTTTITYSVPSGCLATTTYTVNQSPAVIGGASVACIGQSTTLSNTVTGGSWSSSSAVAAIGATSGILSGVSAGSTNVTYTMPVTGCFQSASFTVKPVPAPIAGTTVVCAGYNTALSDTGSGTWSSNNLTIATVGTSGIVAGSVAGVDTIVYTAPNGCAASARVTVNAVPASITGANGCVGAATAFTDATAFGAWSSSNTSVATIGSSTGILTGASVGTATVSYTLSTGCYMVSTISVNTLPANVTGTAVLCAGATTTLNNVTPGGSWTSSNTAMADIDPVSGEVSAYSAGHPVMTYTLPTGCFATQVATVNALPAAIGGTTSVYCIGSTATLADVTTGGTWSSSDITTATVTSSGVVTGVAAGNAVITYMLPTGCMTTLNENITSTPATIAGSANACVGATNSYSDLTAFGAWSSSNTSVVAIGSGTGIVTGVAEGTAVITYSLSSFCQTTKVITVNTPPDAIAGDAFACAGLSSNLSDTGTGSWSSSVPYLASVNSLTGEVNAVAAGNAVITYTAPSGCFTTTVYTVNPLPAPIGGNTSVYCIGSTAALSDVSTGGQWTSSDPTIAAVDLTSGVVTGVAAGSAFVTYTLPTGCITTLSEHITSTPAPISGAAKTCVATTMGLSDVTAFGAWSSSDPSIATVGSGTGIVAGVAAGTATITYELSPSCVISKDITVNPSPAAISGTPQVCAGSTATLSNTGGGTWTSSVPALAAIGSSTGIVNGYVPSSLMITYTLPTGCVTTTALTVNPLASILGASSICQGLPTSFVGTIGGGTWASHNAAVANIDAASGTITGFAIGTSTISYTLPTGCITTSVVSVNPPPAPIAGTTSVCQGFTTSLSGVGGGGWYSSDPSIASVGFGTGIVSGLTTGTATISYSLGTTCITTAVVSVNEVPAAITGVTNACPGMTTSLSDGTTGGSWSVDLSTVATVDVSTGVVAGVNAGSTVVTYTMPTGCKMTTVVSINMLPPAITGPMSGCISGTTSLGDSVSGGNWVTVDPTVATIDPASGDITGVATGTTLVTYTLPTGCVIATTYTVNALPTAEIMTGGGSFCLGGAGVHIGLSNSDTGVVYQLFNGSFASGAALPGTDSTLDFGLRTTTGTYIVYATNSATGCATSMAGTSVINNYPLPDINTMTGGGHYCVHDSGVHVGLGGSELGINYQLYMDTVAAGVLAGTGLPLDFGLKTAVGAYSVKATSTTTGCVSNMAGMTVVVTDSAVAPMVSLVAQPGLIIAPGVTDTLAAVVTNGVTGLTYQWFKNGTAISGATSDVFVSDSLANNDSLSCQVTGGLCRVVSNSSVIVRVRTAQVQEVNATFDNVSLLPNPNKGTFMLKGQVAVQDNESIDLDIFDMVGRKVYTERFNAENGIINKNIKLANDLASGTYILNLKSATSVKVFHIVVNQ